jgi:hypothetical protein
MIRCICLLLLLTACTAGADGLNLAPLVYWESDGEGTWDLRVAGPLFQASSDGSGADLYALRPLAIRLRTPAVEEDHVPAVVRREILWPFSSWRLRENELQAWFGPLVRTNDDVTDPESGVRRWLFPILYSGSDKEGKSYRAVFPIAGTVRDVAGFDEVKFSLFPLYASTTRRELTGHYWMWPIFGHSKGRDVEKWRVFPFWGAAEREGQWRREYVMWPFYHRQLSLSNTADGGFFFFPFYGRIHKGKEGEPGYFRRHTFLWPFFSKVEADGVELLHAPWPFVQRVKSTKEDYERLAFFPFWGKHRRAHLETTFMAWPFAARHHDKRERETIHRTYVMPFYWSFRAESVQGTRKYLRVWPFFSKESDFYDNHDVRILDIWPLRQTSQVDRAYAPWWTLYRDRQVEGSRQRELLWGVWARQDGADGSSRNSVAWLYDRRESAEGEVRHAWFGGLLKRTRSKRD